MPFLGLPFHPRLLSRHLPPRAPAAPPHLGRQPPAHAVYLSRLVAVQSLHAVDKLVSYNASDDCHSQFGNNNGR